MNIVTEKKCTKCGEVKNINEFRTGFRKDRQKIFIRNNCKLCEAHKTREYYLNNTYKALKATALWIINNIEKRKKSTKDWREKNAERYKATKQAYRDKHREEERKQASLWAKEHPEKRRISERNRRARKRGGDGTISIYEWKELCNRYDNKCLCCGKSNVKLTIDHVVPLKLGGVNRIENAQPLCGSCNSRKGAKHIDYRK